MKITPGSLILVRQGTKYGSEYVDLLKKQAKETSGLETYVLGDGEDADIRLKYGWTGWWAKMSLFAPDMPYPFIYIDLDSYILGDISELMGKTMIAKEWHPNWRACGRVQSSMIAMGEYRPDIWEKWTDNPKHWMDKFYGDQKFLEMFPWDYIQDSYKGMIGSYKLHNKDKPVDKVITFHGRPKPPQADGWARDIWNNR